MTTTELRHMLKTVSKHEDDIIQVLFTRLDDAIATLHYVNINVGSGDHNEQCEQETGACLERLGET